MSVPAGLRYTAEHEWVSVDDPTATVGITDFAARALGDVVYVSLPAEGASVTAEEPCEEVESTKSVSDLYSPVDGEVTEVNGSPLRPMPPRSGGKAQSARPPPPTCAQSNPAPATPTQQPTEAPGLIPSTVFDCGT
jgi:hypothetical protein